jgi:hypothetical protein
MGHRRGEERKTVGGGTGRVDGPARALVLDGVEGRVPSPSMSMTRAESTLTGLGRRRRCPSTSLSRFLDVTQLECPHLAQLTVNDMNSV